MKRFTIILATVAMILGGQIASAQGKYGADSAECIKYLSYYTEYFKQKNYDQALPNWRIAYRLCPPTASQNMLINGNTLIKRLISKNAKNPEYRNALVDSLMTLYDLRAQYYPKNAVTALNNKGLDLNNYYGDNKEKLYTELTKIVEANGKEVRPSILLVQLNSAIDMYQNGKLGAEDVINLYQKNIALLGEIQAEEKPSESEQNAKVKSDMEGLFITSKVASCENLIALFTPRYEANPNDIDLVNNIVKMMASTEDCTDNELFLKAATAMHNAEPSAQSAYFLYRLNNSKGNIEEASKFMEQAIGFDNLDPATAADYNLQYATFCVKNDKKARALEAAQKALELDSNLAGKAYYLMGTVWGSTKCGGDEISSRAPYWVACDFMNKAMAADASLAEDCRKLIGQYSVYFPKAADAFMYDLTNGQTYTVACGGLRAVTTVRTQK